MNPRRLLVGAGCAARRRARHPEGYLSPLSLLYQEREIRHLDGDIAGNNRIQRKVERQVRDIAVEIDEASRDRVYVESGRVRAWRNCPIRPSERPIHLRARDIKLMQPRVG